MRLLLVALQWWSREDRKQCLKEGGSTISCKVKWGLSSIILIQQHCQVSPFTSYPNNHSSLHESCDKYYYFLFVPEISSEEKECLVQAGIWQTLLHVFFPPEWNWLTKKVLLVWRSSSFKLKILSVIFLDEPHVVPNLYDFSFCPYNSSQWSPKELWLSLYEQKAHFPNTIFVFHRRN